MQPLPRNTTKSIAFTFLFHCDTCTDRHTYQGLWKVWTLSCPEIKWRTFQYLQTCFVFSYLYQINILQHATGAVEGENTTELDLLRMAVTNSVLDPWIYILLRKESLMFVLRVVERLTGRKVKLGQKLSGISTANRRCCNPWWCLDNKSLALGDLWSYCIFEYRSHYLHYNCIWTLIFAYDANALQTDH